jgi:hypothetical protein
MQILSIEDGPRMVGYLMNHGQLVLAVRRSYQRDWRDEMRSSVSDERVSIHNASH